MKQIGKINCDVWIEIIGKLIKEIQIHIYISYHFFTLKRINVFGFILDKNDKKDKNIHHLILPM